MAPAQSTPPANAPTVSPDGKHYRAQPLTKEIAEAIFREKKAAKKGWDKLGVSNAQLDQLTKLVK